VQGAFRPRLRVNYPGLILRAGSSPEQRWTTADPARDNHDGANATANTRPGTPRAPDPQRERGGLPDGALPGLGPRPRGSLRGREASARDPSYFLFTSTPAPPEETLLTCTANWYVVDCVGGVKPISVPGSYFTDMM